MLGQLLSSSAPDRVAPFDVLIDLVRVTPGDAARLTRYVADGGVAVSTAGSMPADTGRSVRSADLWVRSDADQLAHLVAEVDTGRVRMHVADRRPLRELAAVHDAAGAGRLAGKTVVTVP